MRLLDGRQRVTRDDGIAQSTEEAFTLQYQPIDCGDYDRLEIAIMDRYDVELDLGDQVVVGHASRLETRDGEEFFWIRQSSGREEPIRIDRICRMTVLTRPARFHYHAFAKPD